MAPVGPRKPGNGHAVNEKRIRRLMRLIGLMPIYQKPNTSKPGRGHKTYPYLLPGLRVERPNQVWCVDTTYLPMRRGFLSGGDPLPGRLLRSKRREEWTGTPAWFCRGGSRTVRHEAAIGPRTMPDGRRLLPLSADCFAIACRAAVRRAERGNLSVRAT